MDANTCLAALRKATADWYAARERGDEADALMAADDMAEQAEALDAWLTRGGFLPADWRNATL